MKTILRTSICILVTLGLLFSMTACGTSQRDTSGSPSAPASEASEKASQPGSDAGSVPSAQEPMSEPEVRTSEDTPEEKGINGSHILVVYFSRTGEQYTVGAIDKGNTAIVAEMIAEQTGADLFEVIPADDHYPMTYDALTDVAKREQNEKARPAYVGSLPDLSQYDTVFIGAPVWWGDWPMILYTVFENNDFSGKKLIPFSTHEGSGLAGFDRKLATACPDSEILDGLAVRGNDTQNQQEQVRDSVNDWLAGLGY